MGVSFKGINSHFARIALVVIALSLAACTPTRSIEISCEEFYETPHRSDDLSVSVGDEISVTLCSNPSTGFQWMEQAEINNPDVIEQVDHEMHPPAEKGQPPPPGTAGVEVWKFMALNPGDCMVSLDYSQPWEGGEIASWTYAINLIVE
jgi:predicted secreted protein